MKKERGEDREDDLEEVEEEGKREEEKSEESKRREGEEDTMTRQRGGREMETSLLEPTKATVAPAMAATVRMDSDGVAVVIGSRDVVVMTDGGATLAASDPQPSARGEEEGTTAVEKNHRVCAVESFGGAVLTREKGSGVDML